MKKALQAIEKSKEKRIPSKMELINMHLGERIFPEQGDHIDSSEIDNLYRLLKIKQNLGKSNSRS